MEVITAGKGALHSRRFAWAMVIAWLAGVMLAFWFFELRSLRPFEAELPGKAFAAGRASLAEAWLQQQSAMPGVRATVVHLVQPGCRCNSDVSTHQSRMESEYATRGVRFLRHELAPVQRGALLGWARTGPSALVFDASGRLAYYGPYSATAMCGTGGGLVEEVLDELLAGVAVPLRPVSTLGCFCDVA